MRERIRGPEHEDVEQEQPAAPALDALDRGLQEFVREEGPALGRGEALKKLADANSDAKKLEERYCEDRYAVSERLVEFAAGRGHVALGYTQLGPCLKEHFGRGRSWAYESMKFAKAATRRDIAGMEWGVAKLGLELLPLMKVTTFGELTKKPLPVIGRDGEPVHFPAAPELLEAALEELTKRTRPEPKTEEEARAVERATLRRCNELLERHLAERPELAEAEPKVYIRDGKAQLKFAPVELRSEVLPAVNRFIADMLRVINRG